MIEDSVVEKRVIGDYLAEEFDVRLSEDTVLAAVRWGPKSGKRILAIHGWLDNAASFERIAPLLTDCCVVAIDIRGHGKSSHKDEADGYLVIDAVKDIFFVADVLGWDTFSLLGHSMGGAICALAAGTLPGRINQVMCISVLSPMESSDSATPQQLESAITQQVGNKQKKAPVYDDLNAMVSSRMRGITPMSQRAAEILVRRGSLPVEGGFAWSSDAKHRLPYGMRLNAEQVKSFLSRINAPVCLLLEERGFFPRAYLQERIDYVKNISVHEIPGNHHMHLEEEVEIVAEIANSFFHAPT